MNQLVKVAFVSVIAGTVLSCGVLEWVENSAGVAAPADSPSNNAPAASSESSSSAPVGSVLAGNGEPLTLGTNNTVRLNGNDVSPDASPLSVAGAGNIELIFQTDRCNLLSRGGFVWFTNQVTLDDWLAPLEPEVIKDVQSKIDFSKQGALLLDYGIAGSRGAGAAIVGDRLKVVDQQATVVIKQFTAPKIKRTPQVITHPCSLFAMPRDGFKRLTVQSDLGDELLVFENN